MTAEVLQQLSAGCQGGNAQLIASHSGIFCVTFMRLRGWVTHSETESLDAQSKYRMWTHCRCVRLHKHQLWSKNTCWKFRLKQAGTVHTALNKHRKFQFLWFLLLHSWLSASDFSWLSKGWFASHWHVFKVWSFSLDLIITASAHQNCPAVQIRGCLRLFYSSLSLGIEK